MKTFAYHLQSWQCASQPLNCKTQVTDSSSNTRYTQNAAERHHD